MNAHYVAIGKDFFEIFSLNEEIPNAELIAKRVARKNLVYVHKIFFEKLAQFDIVDTALNQTQCDSPRMLYFIKIQKRSGARERENPCLV